MEEHTYTLHSLKKIGETTGEIRCTPDYKKEGHYSAKKLLDMEALHLDATYAKCNIWKEFVPASWNCLWVNKTEYQRARL